MLVFSFPPRSGVVVLAASVREPLLQVGGSARLHDTGRDGRLPEPEGALGRPPLHPPLHLHPGFYNPSLD